MPAHLHAIRDDNLIAKFAVMGHMRVGHDEAVRSDARPSRCGRTAVHGDVFAKTGTGADADVGFFPAVFEILRGVPDDDAVGKRDACIQARTRIDMAEWSDADAGG